MPATLNQNRPNTDFMDTWIGHHISGIIRGMGPATQITDDGAGGRIYIWVEHYQRTAHKPYLVVPPKQHTSNHSHTLNVPQETKTRGTMRWDPLLERWEYESETKSTSRIPDISRTVREADRVEPQPQLRFKTSTKNYTSRVMFYTRSDGTIYHWLIITPNNHYGYNNQGNAKNNAHDYNNRSLSKEEEKQHLDDIRRYDMTIYLFPDDAKAYFNRGIAKYELGQTSEAKQDLRRALQIATEQGKVNLKNNIEKTLRDLYQQNAKKDEHDYNIQNSIENKKKQYLDDIKRYDTTIYFFRDDAKAYLNRGIAKYKLGQTSEAKQDLHRALWLATQQGKVNLKNSIEKTLRDLQ